MKGLETAIISSKEDSTQSILDSILQQLVDFKKGVECKDDIALLCLRIK
jgi:serine phosphatase RsbU (regulator of sigma subunit)